MVVHEQIHAYFADRCIYSRRLIGAAFISPSFSSICTFCSSVVLSFPRFVSFALNALEHVLSRNFRPLPPTRPLGRRTSVGRLLSLCPTTRSVGRSSRAISRALRIFFSFFFLSFFSSISLPLALFFFLSPPPTQSLPRNRRDSVQVCDFRQIYCT